MQLAPDGIPEDMIARILVSTGKVRPAQLDGARELIFQMGQLGVERDLLGALIDRKAISAAEAEEVRALAAQEAAADPDDPEIEMAEAVGEEGEDGGEHAKAPLLVEEDARNRCANHPDQTAVATCRHCSKPICARCAVRTDHGTFCSETCLMGWRHLTTAKSADRAAQIERSYQVGRLIVIGAVVGVVIALGLLVKYLVNDYQFTSSLERAARSSTTSEDAVRLLTRAVDLRPDHAKARAELGKALLRVGEVGQSIDTLQEALRIEPENTDALEALATGYMAKRRHQEAASALERLRKAGKSSYDVNRQLGMIYLQHLDRPADAVEAFDAAIRAGSESRELRYLTGRALLDLGKTKEARVALDRAIVPVSKAEGASAGRERQFLSDRRKMAEIRATLADIALKEGDAAQALRHLEEAQDAAPEVFGVVKRRVELLTKAGRTSEALAAAELSAQHLMSNAAFLRMLCGLQEQAGLDKKRLVTLRALYRAEPDSPGAFETLVEAEAAHGNLKAARAMLESLPLENRRKARFTDAWVAIVRAQAVTGDASGAEGTLKDLGPATDKDPRFAVLWCEVLHRQGRDAEAIGRAKHAIDRAPRDPVAYLVLGTVYRKLDQTREAFENIRKSAALGGGGQAKFQLGMILLEGGYAEEAVRLFAEAKADKQLPARAREVVDTCLDRFRGGVLTTDENAPLRRRGSPVFDLGALMKDLDRPRTGATGVLKQIHRACYGISRVSAIITGSAELSANRDEVLRMEAARTGGLRINEREAINSLLKELDVSIRAFSRAMVVVSPRAKDEVQQALDDCQVGAASAAGAFGGIVAVSRAQARMVEAVLRTHPCRSALTLRLESILMRKRVRQAISPGDLQEAVCADLAVTEMLAALIDVGPCGPIYRGAVDSVLAGLPVADATATDAFSQVCASRTACFKMLWVLSRQLAETAGMEGDI